MIYEKPAVQTVQAFLLAYDVIISPFLEFLNHASYIRYKGSMLIEGAAL